MHNIINTNKKLFLSQRELIKWKKQIITLSIILILEL